MCKSEEAAKNGSWHDKCKGLWNGRPQTCSTVLQDDEKNTAVLIQDEKKNGERVKENARERDRVRSGHQTEKHLKQQILVDDGR